MSRMGGGLGNFSSSSPQIEQQGGDDNSTPFATRMQRVKMVSSGINDPTKDLPTRDPINFKRNKSPDMESCIYCDEDKS